MDHRDMDETALGIEMHRIEPSVARQPRAVETSVSCSAGGGSGGVCGADTCVTWGEPPTGLGGGGLHQAAGGFVASSRASFASDAATEVGEQHPHGYSRDAISTAPTLHSRSSTPVDRATRAGAGLHGAKNRFALFWAQHISVRVPGSGARDHLAIERTFLAYHRTALVFALAATSVAQLFVLNHKANPNPSFGFYVLGKPLAVALVSLSLGLTLLGWWRWYTWQRNTIRGVCIVGGWELEGILFVMMSFLLTIFGITIGIGIHKILYA